MNINLYNQARSHNRCFWVGHQHIVIRMVRRCLKRNICTWICAIRCWKSYQKRKKNAKIVLFSAFCFVLGYFARLLWCTRWRCWKEHESILNVLKAWCPTPTNNLGAYMVSIARILHSVDFRKVGMSKYCRKQPKKSQVVFNIPL